MGTLQHRWRDDWDEDFWTSLKPVYEEAFPTHGRKNDTVIARILNTGIGSIHGAFDVEGKGDSKGVCDGEVAGMGDGADVGEGDGDRDDTGHRDDTDHAAVAMAVTGILPELSGLLIDYFAVARKFRRQAIGRAFLEQLLQWAGDRQLRAVVIEVVADDDATLAFWTANGFTVTSYVHQYVWVPEPYRALYRTLDPSVRIPTDGETLFHSITKWHGKAYRPSKGRGPA